MFDLFLHLHLSEVVVLYLASHRLWHGSVAPTTIPSIGGRYGVAFSNNTPTLTRTNRLAEEAGNDRHVARSRVQKPDIIILDHDNGILKKTFLLILLQTGNVTLSFNCRLRMSVAPKSLHIGARWLQ